MKIKCDLCSNDAKYDCKLPLHGAWGNICETCFIKYDCKLGLGLGQKLKELK